MAGGEAFTYLTVAWATMLVGPWLEFHLMHNHLERCVFLIVIPAAHPPLLGGGILLAVEKWAEMANFEVGGSAFFVLSKVIIFAPEREELMDRPKPLSHVHLRRLEGRN